MKKISSLFLILLVCVCIFYSCSPDNNLENIKSEQHAVSQSNTDISNNGIKNTTEESGGEMPNDSGGADITPRKYRTCYYSVTYSFAELVGIDEYWNWAEKYNTENPDDTNEMVIKKFVQHFNISRENFDKANLKHAKIRAEGVDDYPVMNPKDYADQEPDEIYNADIIYTFDDEIINNYYLTPEYAFGWRIEYEEALKSGTYETRTTDWVDIEQMEADIIAKYGEAEIVTEATTTEQTETVTAG